MTMENNTNTTPLVKGGQGRSGSELVGSSIIVTAAVVVALIAIVFALVTS